MKAVIWIVLIAAVVFLIVGAVARALAFLLWAAPVLIIVAVALFILSRSAGPRRLP
ncbi:MAG TPA: hypothetical protein VGN49_10865 [Micrococcaceae bacterium]|jgi:uncharacterized membrane protein required for colicin V production|nr:hypothetical protein [Micrococcaceae bacterium]